MDSDEEAVDVRAQLQDDGQYMGDEYMVDFEDEVEDQLQAAVRGTRSTQMMIMMLCIKCRTRLLYKLGKKLESKTEERVGEKNVMPRPRCMEG